MANNRRGHRGRGHRPQRGRPAQPDDSASVLVTGDTGVFGGDQGGAEPGATESGDELARAYGVPQADLPGGVRHLVNPETIPADTIAKRPRPADLHKEHGVEPLDDGQYVTPAGELDLEGEIDLEGIPAADTAVPVYITEGPHTAKRITALVTEGPQNIPTGTADPIRVADRDPARKKFWICNESTPNPAGSTNPGVRLGDWETVADGRGLLIPAGQIKDFHTQDSQFITNQSGTAVTLSWGYETDIPAARPDLS